MYVGIVTNKTCIFCGLDELYLSNFYKYLKPNTIFFFFLILEIFEEQRKIHESEKKVITTTVMVFTKFY